MSGIKSETGEWCRMVFDGLRDGGMWALPRSALIWKKRGTCLILTDRMPYRPDLPYTEVDWHERQQSDFEATRDEFAKVGITVKDESKAV